MANVNNTPLVDENRLVLNYRPLFVLDGIEFATMSVLDACISSGHGRRNGKLHKGIDYYSRKGGPIFAAAVPRGFTLGPMGQTAAYAVPQHLHFELLQGDYDNPKKSFWLSSADLFDLL